MREPNRSGFGSRSFLVYSQCLFRFFRTTEPFSQSNRQISTTISSFLTRRKPPYTPKKRTAEISSVTKLPRETSFTQRHAAVASPIANRMRV